MQDDEDEKELKEMFRVLDKEKKGEVDVKELRWIMKNLGDDLSEEDIDDMIADVDTDGSGWVDYDGRSTDWLTTVVGQLTNRLRR